MSDIHGYGNMVSCNGVTVCLVSVGPKPALHKDLTCHAPCPATPAAYGPLGALPFEF